jgi:hypothetical protein
MLCNRVGQLLELTSHLRQSGRSIARPQPCTGVCWNGARGGIASDPKALKYSFFSVENFGKYQQVYHHELLMDGFDSNTQVCSGLALIELPQP